jgi:hypothetical protein
MSAPTEWNAYTTHHPMARKQGSPLLYFLGFIFALFIGILIFCYVVTKRTNPVFVDVHGRPVAESSQSSHH